MPKYISSLALAGWLIITPLAGSYIGAVAQTARDYRKNPQHQVYINQKETPPTMSEFYGRNKLGVLCGGLSGLVFGGIFAIAIAKENKKIAQNSFLGRPATTDFDGKSDNWQGRSY